MRFQNLTLPIERVSWRGPLAGCNVTVHQHRDGTLSIIYGPHRLGRYTAPGRPTGINKDRCPTGDCGRLTTTGHFTCYKERTFSFATNSFNRQSEATGRLLFREYFLSFFVEPASMAVFGASGNDFYQDHADDEPSDVRPVRNS